MTCISVVASTAMMQRLRSSANVTWVGNGPDNQCTLYDAYCTSAGQVERFGHDGKGGVDEVRLGGLRGSCAVTLYSYLQGGGLMDVILCKCRYCQSHSISSFNTFYGAYCTSAGQVRPSDERTMGEPWLAEVRGSRVIRIALSCLDCITYATHSFKLCGDSVDADIPQITSCPCVIQSCHNCVITQLCSCDI